MRRLGGLIVALIIITGVGCAANVPATVAVDYDRIDRNVQQIIPKYELMLVQQLKVDIAAREVAVATSASTTSIDADINDIRHNLLLSEATRGASTSMLKWCMNHTNASDFGKIKAERSVAASPTVR